MTPPRPARAGYAISKRDPLGRATVILRIPVTPAVAELLRAAARAEGVALATWAKGVLQREVMRPNP